MEKIVAIRKKIRLARIEKEYSQYYMGSRLYKSQIAYHNLENGKSNLKVDTLLRIAVILEADMSYFFEFDEIDKNQV
jgi:transcriptional regulator with XRE-family HTH domain